MSRSCFFRLLAVPLFLVLAVPPSFADFIGRKGTTLRERGDAVYNSFTVSQTTTFTFYFAADYSATAVIFDSGSLQRFLDGGSISYYDGFDGNFGLTTVTLGPGDYTLGVRNKNNGANIISFELEIAPVEVSGATYYDTYFSEATTLRGGALLWQPFTVQEGFTYVVEGLNTGLDFFLIPEAELSDFRNRRTFQYYSDYYGLDDKNQPGLFTLRLAPGDYYLAFRNSDSDTHSLVYAMYRYSGDAGDGGTGGGGETSGGAADVALEGSTSYAIDSSGVVMRADRVINNGNGASGRLELSLWAVDSPYAGGSLSGYKLGTVALDALSAGYYYSDVEVVSDYDAPPDGSYYLLLVLSEQIGGDYFIVDYVNFSSRQSFGNSSSNVGAGPDPIPGTLDGGVMHLPEVKIGQTYYEVDLVELAGEPVTTYQVIRARKISKLSGASSGVYAAGFVDIPVLLIGGVSHSATLQLVDLQQLVFTLFRLD